MSDVGFHETRDGRQFCCVTMPELVRQLTRLNELLALAVEIADKQTKDKRDVRPRED